MESVTSNYMQIWNKGCGMSGKAKCKKYFCGAVRIGWRLYIGV
ncbi:hypothetical protein CRENPOLYSF2_1760001 [Crenothrix polyspora]|uniref:Uncharacterized protein n=1 Tax=Crenothrix polyspora TaxID=360316 RepID=A0A1R4H394_9GAMM|nr:hypothetical protein CRENPOLYSF2_1760001 [Crenothrix polyspora]